MKTRELWTSMGIIAAILIAVIVGYYIIRPSTCENAADCGGGSNVAEYFANRDYSLDIKKQWKNLLKTAKGTNYMVEMENPANTKYVFHQTAQNEQQGNGLMGAEDSNPEPDTSMSYPINPIRNSYFQIDMMIKNDLSESQQNWNNTIQIVQYQGPNKEVMYIPNKTIYSNKMDWKSSNENIQHNNPWYNLQIIFKIGHTIESTQSPYYLTISIPPNATYQQYTILSVKPIQNIYQSFPEYNNIAMFLDSRIPESYNGNGTIWNNLIDNSKSVRWSNKPFWSNGAFHFGTSKIQVTGQPSTFITDGKKPEEVEFTLIWNYQQNVADNNGPSQHKYAPFITFYGNQNIALEVHIPLLPFYPIKIVCADKYYIGDISYDPTQMNHYILTYRRGRITIWIQGRKYFEQQVRVPYMNSRKFEINAKYRLNGIMQYLILYDIALVNTQIPIILNSIQNYPSLYHDLQSGKSVLNIFSTTQPSIKSMASNAPSAITCPRILFDKDTAEYQIYIDQQNPYDPQAGKVGIYFSSPNKQEVLQKYLKNFIGCPVPDILQDRVIMENCPFRGAGGNGEQSSPLKVPFGNRNNPCHSRECFNMNWNPNELNPGELMTPACGQKIDQYCQRQYKNEPICNCWDPAYKQTPQCAKMRGLITGKMQKKPQVRSLYPVDENPEYPFWMKKSK